MPELSAFLPIPTPTLIVVHNIHEDFDMSDPLLQAVHEYTVRQAGTGPYATAIDGLVILRSNHEKPPNHLIFRPALCITLQGSKSTVFGNHPYEYRAGQALVVGVERPALSRVTEASPEKPYLGIVLELDLAMMREVMEGLDHPPAAGGTPRNGVLVTDFDGPLSDCALRMVRLLGTPKAIPMLCPVIMREICYWLLSGPHGGDVAGMTLANSHAQRVIRAIHALRSRFAEAVRIDQLAAIAQLSPSAFHRRFKAVTSMTPLQYQKQLRLLEARRLMASGAVNVETAAFRVGYESASQFSREYSRMFGTPPRRDIEALKLAAA